jgi:alkanesulfonate monooxygenase SsuD/methylene tetrahydromethanopterin reductase-like flavin-dependent oxidoreductase (luciferase family)
VQVCPRLPWHQGQVGCMLAYEQCTMPQLVELGIAAAQAGFDFVATSDHLQPWQDNKGYSGLAWGHVECPGSKDSSYLIRER